MVSTVSVTSGILNAPALIILLALTLLLIKGTKESASVNAIIVFIKVAIVLVFIFVGWKFIKPENHTPYLIPEGTLGHEGFFKWGWGGVLGGAAIVFFAFIGFDAVSTTAQEAKNPKRDMPIGILGSLVVCTILYLLFGHVLKGVANNLQGNIQLIIEANSGEFFNKKNLANGKGFYTKSIPSMLGDFGKSSSKSLVGMLVEDYDAIQGSFTDNYGRSVSGSVANKLFRTNTLFFNQHFGEHEIQVSTLFALMNREKVVDNESGEEITLLDVMK
jgi:hypothetical protein